jgi:tetratricopeptide (TPR) repeat protein
LGIDHANLSCLLAEEGRWPEAVQAMQSALALEPDQPLYYLNLGAYLEAMGEGAAAQREYAQLLRRQPHLIQSGYWTQTEDRAEMLAGMVQPVIQDQATGLPALVQLSLKSQGAEAAQKIYDNYLAAWPVEPALAHLEQGKILLAQARLEAAQAEFEAAVQLNPRLGEAYLGLSQVAGLAQRWEEAGQYAEAAVFLEPTPAGWVQQAVVAEASGQTEAAVEGYEAAFSELTATPELELSRYATETARRTPFPVSHYLPCLVQIYPTGLLAEITQREGRLLEQQGAYRAAGQVYRRLLAYEPGVEPVAARLKALCQGRTEVCEE